MSTPSGCCDPRVFDHLQAAFRQRLGIADQGECPLVLDLGLIIVDGVGGFHLKGSGFASEGFDEDLHTSAEMKNENASLVLDLGLDVVDCVRRVSNSDLLQLYISKHPQSTSSGREQQGLRAPPQRRKTRRTNEFQKQQSKKKQNIPSSRLDSF